MPSRDLEPTERQRLQWLLSQPPGALTVTAKAHHDYPSLVRQLAERGWLVSIENHGRPCARVVPA